MIASASRHSPLPYSWRLQSRKGLSPVRRFPHSDTLDSQPVCTSNPATSLPPKISCLQNSTIFSHFSSCTSSSTDKFLGKMSRSSQEVPPHLIAYYKILDLPVGSPFKDVQSRYHQLNARLRRSCGRHNGEAAYKFIPKLDKAFQSLKQAHFQPNSARQAPPHPLQPVQNAPYHQPSGYSPIEQTPQDPHASGNQSSGAVSDTPRISQHPPLNPVPKYTPQSRFMHQPRHGMAPGFSIKHIQSNIFDAAEDRAVIVRESALHE